MKFTKELKYNAVEEWRGCYINYAAFKRIIYVEEKRRFGGISSTQSGIPEDVESPHQDIPNAPPDDKAFVSLLESELSRVHGFYTAKERELGTRLDELINQARGVELAETSVATPSTDSITRPLLRRSSSRTHGSMVDLTAEAVSVEFWAQDSDFSVQAVREQLRDEMQQLFVLMTGLQRFIDLNIAGFRKALKKHDKVLAGNDGAGKLKDTYMPVVERQCCLKRKQILEGALFKLQRLYAVVCCNGSSELALVDLKRRLGETVQFERNTVWKDMVQKDRRTGTLRVEERMLASWYQTVRQPAAIALSLAVFFALLYAPTFEQPEKSNCLALLALVSLLWCTEALPLFVTSMLVPLLAVVLRVLVDSSQQPPQRLTPQQAAPRIFHAMCSQVIMLLLGGFTIAAALSKHAIAKSLASWALSRVGQQPANVLLANMLTASFASMWISNVAAPVLCFSLVEPILRTLDANHSFAKSLVIGIALASNLGGMTSPISSPQNLFAIERMSMDGTAPSWLAWFAVALPVALAGNLLCWLLLRVVYRDASFTEVRPLQAIKDPISAKQWYIVVVSLVSVLLWCLNTLLQRWTGEMGIIAILPMVAFYGFGILNKDDFNSMLWNVVMLAMGGLALGEAVTSSGLLLTIAQELQRLVAGCGVWEVLAIFCGLVLAATTFISHTVGAIVILPIIQSVGAALPDPHPRLLVMGAALMCSGAMGLPVSGFPNMTAVALEDSRGLNYVSTIDFLKVGLLSSVMAYVLIVTLGYSIMAFVIGW